MDNQDSFVDYVKTLTVSEIQTEMSDIEAFLDSDGTPRSHLCEEVQILRRALNTLSRS